jgi:glutamyl-tRNA synthetase
MPTSEVRVRFAPSPTGPLHIGGVRTALFNYLFARKNNGKFVLRIEDTDQARYIQGAEDYIIESLTWCGIEPDEGVSAGGIYGPYRQSERKEKYLEYSLKLVASGYAYYAFDTPEELDNLRNEYERKKMTFMYDSSVRDSLNNSLNLMDEELKKILDKDTPFVIRFRMPEDREILFNDVVRGEVRVNTSTLDDKILFKTDGMPTYHLANVVDDYLMKISHVIRGEEWLPSTPLHILLYEALGWKNEMPVFAHMPLTLKPDGKGKLSKRDGDRLGFPVFPIEWKNPETGEISSGYRESGYLPEAFLNILAFLGWNPGTGQELFTLNELIREFSLDRIIKSGSKFDPEKARWFNHQYLVRKSNEELAGPVMEELKKRGLEFKPDYVARAVGIIKERAFLLTELWDQSWFFFIAPGQYDEKVIKKVWKEDTGETIQDVLELMMELDGFDKTNLETIIKKYVSEKESGFGKVMNPLRLLLVGSNSGPGLLDIMEILSKNEVVRRIQRGLEEVTSDK